MNVYVITRNHYLYRGIVHSLQDTSKFTFIHLSPDMKTCREIIKNATPLDILLLVSDYGCKFDFQFLVSASKCRASVVYSGWFDNFKFQRMFGFTLIGGNFYLSDLLQALNVRNNVSRSIRYPKITLQEKKILFHLWKGVSVTEIARFLSVEPKTVYQHQRNVLNKIGIRKARDLFLLPKNFIEYMYLVHAD